MRKLPVQEMRFPLRALLILTTVVALGAALGRAMLLYLPTFSWSFLVGLVVAAICIGVVRLHMALDAHAPVAIALTLVAGFVALFVALSTDVVLRDPLAFFAGLAVGLPLFGFSERMTVAFLSWCGVERDY